MVAPFNEEGEAGLDEGGKPWRHRPQRYNMSGMLKVKESIVAGRKCRVTLSLFLCLARSIETVDCQ